MTNNFETLSFAENKGIGLLTINRPDKLNALNIQLLRELKLFLSELGRSAPRGLILTGEGEKAFIAGADIAEMRPMSTTEARAFSELGQQVSLLLERLPCPSIAAVNGYALGGGFEMAMSCDFIFATSNAVFGLPEVKLGLIPGFGATVRLLRIIGERRAKEITFSGRSINSEEAQGLGIALKVFPTKDDLLEGCQKWFELTDGNSPAAISRVKHAFCKASQEVIDESLVIEREEFSNLFETPQMLEGTSAFMEKRKPQF